MIDAEICSKMGERDERIERFVGKVPETVFGESSGPRFPRVGHSNTTISAAGNHARQMGIVVSVILQRVDDSSIYKLDLISPMPPCEFLESLTRISIA